MCGLFGFAGKMESAQRKTLLRALCVFNAERGEDSVGLASINRRANTINTYRECVAPESAINAPAFVEVCDDSGQVWIGHTRQATHGTVSVENAHPFHIGNVIGAHNGMISVTKELIARCDNAAFDVDSQYLIYLLDRDGAIGEITGCAALSWCDLRNTADVSFIRHHNPLWIACEPSDAWIAWSSEFPHLRNALALAGVTEYATIQFENGKQIDITLADNGAIDDMSVSDNNIVTRYVSVSRTPTHSSAWDAEFDCSPRSSIAVDIDDDESAHDDYLTRLAREDEREYLREYFNTIADDEIYALTDDLDEMDSNDYRSR